MKKLLLLLLLIASFQMTHAQCTAMFSYSGGTAPPAVINFSDSSTGFSPPVTYQWDFGDGSTSNISNPVHTYAANGLYSVCLIVTDGICTDSVCNVIVINTPTPTLNLYSFDVDSMSLYHCTAPQSVPFFYYGSATGYQNNDSLLFEVSFGDGIDTTFYVQLLFPNFQGSVTHMYLNPGTYTAQVVVTAPDTQMQTVTAQTITINSNCGPVSGTVYEDLNGNCIYDIGDILLPNVSLEIYDGTQFVGWTTTDINGVYSFNVPAGPVYDIHVNASGGYNGHYTATCPASGIITISSVPSSGNDFGLSCPPAFDLTGSISGWGFRPGFTTSVCVFVYNQFCNTPTGQIEIVLDPNLTPLPDTTGAGYTIVGNTVVLPIGSPDLYWSFCFPVTVAVGAQIGDSVCITMNLTPVAGDSFPANNVTTHCFPVRNSWDPNDKYVEPAGVGPQGAVLPGTELTYTVRFQNTGNAEAINIYILDTLDSDLDPASLEVIASSHDMQWSLLSGNILRFNFDNILLADSNTNEPASHGYVTYRIRPFANVTHLSAIDNSAAIFFDFNPPIYTNTTLNTIDYFLSAVPVSAPGSRVSVYPNPANEKCHLYFRDNTPREIIITDLRGRVISAQQIQTESMLLDTRSLANGVYTLRILKDHFTEDAINLMINH
jgi:uncharacterized repeat protein (TIGR01451 family)